MSANEKCPKCGAGLMDNLPEYACGFGIEEGAIQFPLCREREARQKAEAEVKYWKGLFVNFAVIHCSAYGKEHFGDGFLHPVHYDLLQEAGARMDDFQKGGAR